MGLLQIFLFEFLSMHVNCGIEILWDNNDCKSRLTIFFGSVIKSHKNSKILQKSFKIQFYL